MRLIEPADQAACQDFDCGDEPYEQAVNDFLHRRCWEPDTKERTLVGCVVGSTEVFGFGAWRYAGTRWDEGKPPPGWEETVLMRMSMFGVDRRFRGATDAAGTKLSERLYASVEADALAGDRSREGMFMELMCERENVHGLRFWRRMGYEDLGQVFDKAHLRHMFRLPPRGNPASDKA